jgi:2-phospho-L-lactate/phosphoenolpyruvate guanylyltransferase
MIPVVIPVKPLNRALGRLADVLDPAGRRALQAAMLTDVLEAATALTPKVVVVTVDPLVAALARGHGARVAPDSDPPAGINQAVARGVAASSARSVLIVMGDVPGATVDDLRQVVASGSSGAGVTLAVSRDGTGTNAMLLSPPDVIAPAFGAGSLDRHLAAAAHADVECTLVTAPGLMLDVDTPEDLAVFSRARVPSHTLELCDALGLEERLAASTAR